MVSLFALIWSHSVIFECGNSLMGKRIFVFWGKDAAEVAQVFHAKEINQREYGWLNLPLDEVSKHADDVQSHIENNKLKVGVDYRFSFAILKS